MHYRDVPTHTGGASRAGICCLAIAFIILIIISELPSVWEGGSGGGGGEVGGIISSRLLWLELW